MSCLNPQSEEATAGRFLAFVRDEARFTMPSLMAMRAAPSQTLDPSPVIGEVIRGGIDKKQAAAHIKTWTQGHIASNEREQFQETAENEILSLHEGNFARYQIRPSEFAAWREAWNR